MMRDQLHPMENDPYLSPKVGEAGGLGAPLPLGPLRLDPVTNRNPLTPHGPREERAGARR